MRSERAMPEQLLRGQGLLFESVRWAMRRLLNAVTGKTSGTRAPVRAGMDPRSDCSDAGRETCGNDGTCDGAGGCRKYATNTTCGAATCSSDLKSEISERKCDGSGNCFPPSSTACGAGEACEGTRCVSTCGQMDQPCCEQQTCKGGLTCLTLTDRIRCGRCGGLGQICCNGPTGPTCSEGDCFAYPNGAVCENCGKRGQRCCKPNDSCKKARAWASLSGRLLAPQSLRWR